MLVREDKPARRNASRMRIALAALALGLALLAAPDVASAGVQTYTETIGPFPVGGYEAESQLTFASHPEDVEGFITRMGVTLVNENGRRMPVRRMMMHHVVFANLAREDATCDSFVDFGEHPVGFGAERFYAAGEEHAKLILPPGYGYELDGTDPWGVIYMIMNHRAEDDVAYIRYRFTVDTDPSIEPVKPYWLDARNCRADPIYNVPGTGGADSTDVRTEDVVIPEGGRIVAGGGHVHGGARMLTLTQPDCGDRELATSVPTWGKRDHPYYQVRPILHEPGPFNMSGFNTPTGFPVAAGERLRMSSLYDDSAPHMRVMGIMILYVASDPTVTDPCGPLPGDVTTIQTDKPGRVGPIPFEVPLYGLKDGEAVRIDAPPGELERVRSGTEIDVEDFRFERRNVSVRRGAELTWRFLGQELHNVTLVNGPVGIGSPNLDAARSFSHEFTKAGTYRLFCQLHPVKMTERVVVRRPN